MFNQAFLLSSRRCVARAQGGGEGGGGRQGCDRGEEVRPLYPRLYGGWNKKTGTTFRSQTVDSYYQNKMQAS